MTNVQKLVDIANAQWRHIIADGDTYNSGPEPYTIVNGEWYFKGKRLSDKSQELQTTMVSEVFVRQILAESADNKFLLNL